MTELTSTEFVDALRRSLERIAPEADNESWRREALVRRILTSDFGLGYMQHEVRSECSFPFTPAQIQKVRAQVRKVHPRDGVRPRRLARNRLRLDFLIAPDLPDSERALVEAKRKAGSASALLDDVPQLLEQQFLAEIDVGALTDGESWAVFRRGQLVLVVESIEDLSRKLPDLRYLLGRESLAFSVKPSVFLLDSAVTAPTDEHLTFESIFPHLLRTGYKLLSPPDNRYNSFAWAAGDTTRWWHPAGGAHFWPEGAGRYMTMSAVLAAYKAIGYELGGSVADIEPTTEYICVYQGRGNPTHAARRSAGASVWTSKLGTLSLISHHLNALEGGEYGAIGCILRRTVH